MRNSRTSVWMEKFGLSKEDAEIVERFASKIPSVTSIIEESWSKTPAQKRDIGYIKSHFSESVMDFERSAYAIYLDYERRAFQHAIGLWIERNKDLINGLAHKYRDHSEFLKKICEPLSTFLGALNIKASQMRKSRGGKSFESIVRFLLNRIGISCQKPKGGEQAKVLKRIDGVIPDQETALSTPDRAFFLSCKRTLRERWKQAIPERKPAWRVFLITIDENLSEDKAEEIDRLGIIAYVKDEVKVKRHLANKNWIRKLSDLPKDLKMI